MQWNELAVVVVVVVVFVRDYLMQSQAWNCKYRPDDYKLTSISSCLMNRKFMNLRSYDHLCAAEQAKFIHELMSMQTLARLCVYVSVSVSATVYALDKNATLQWKKKFCILVGKILAQNLANVIWCDLMWFTETVNSWQADLISFTAGIQFKFCKTLIRFNLVCTTVVAHSVCVRYNLQISTIDPTDQLRDSIVSIILCSN